MRLSVQATRHWATGVGLGIVAYILAYFSLSYAFDSGHIWAYLAVLILLVIGTKEFLRAIRDSWRGRTRGQAR